MSYVGTKVELPLGKLGVRTDDPMSDLAPGELFRGVNVDFSAGTVQKSPGSAKWNGSSAVVPGGIENAFDWYPIEGEKRLVVASSNGQLYRFKNSNRIQTISAQSGSPTSLTIAKQSHFVSGGQQTATMARKLFYFSGNDQVQVVEGNSLVRRNIEKPAVEWTTGNYPKYGIVFRNYLWCFGMTGQPHTIIGSAGGDEEDFQDTISGDPVKAHVIYPGEGERIVTAWVFRGKLFVAKYPIGIYMLNDDAQSSTDWYFQKAAASFGAISAHSAIEVADDMYIANQFGTVTSLSAAFQLGNIKMADLIGNLRVEQEIRNEMRPQEQNSRWSVYYPDKKLALFTYQSASGTGIDRFFCVDMNSQRPKVFIMNKDSINCLFLMKNDAGNMVPAYGASDGYIYVMDDVNRSVGGSGFSSEFRIPYTDFNVETNKMYDFLEVECEHTGLWTLSCDVFIDDSFSETITYYMSSAPVLRSSGDTSCFQLDRDRLIGRQTKNLRKMLHGRGRVISFKFYTGSNTQNFKITKLVIYTRMGNEDKKA